jgi:hypothetical protein
MKRFLTIALLLLGCASVRPAQAAVDPALQTIIDALASALGEPALSDAAPMIDCIIQHGTGACFDVQGLAEAQGKQAVAKFVPTDPMIQAVVAIIQAVNKRDWLKVLELTGTDVLLRVACHAGLSVAGPVQGFVCNGPFDKVVHLAKPVVRTVLVFVGDPTPKNLLAVIESNVDPDLACSFTPDFPGKAALCGALGELVQLGKDAVKLAAGAGKALWYGAGDVLGTNDPKAMSQEDYYALAWTPWYHYGTWLCLRNGCKGIGDVAGHVWHPCKDYFASHDMTSSTAQDACDNMRDNKFYPRVKAFAQAMPVAAEAYIEVMRPLAKQWAVSDYGSSQALLANKPAFVQGCLNKLTVKFPFPPPDPGRCEAIKQSPFYNSSMFSQVMHQAYSTCVSDAKKQLPSPTVWASACHAATPKFVAMLNAEEKALQQKVPGLAAEGCLPPAGWSEPQGIKLECRTYTAYNDCLGVMSGASKPTAHCVYDQQKVDKDIVSKIMVALGHKRCKASGSEIACSRPWKVHKCQTLRAQLASGAPTGVQCRSGPPAEALEFALMAQQAKDIVSTLNGGVANEKKSSGGLIVKPLFAPGNHGCETGWDPLSIGCSDPNTPAHVDGRPNFGPCPPTVSEDGVDAPCLRTSASAHLEQSASAKPQRNAGADVRSAPPSGPQLRLGTARPTSKHARSTIGRPLVAVAVAQATLEANCAAPQPALIASVTLRNSGGPLGTNQGEIYVKEFGGANLSSAGVPLPAIGAGRSTMPLKIPLITLQPYSSLPGQHRLAVMLQPSTMGGMPGFDQPPGAPYTLVVDIPIGHCTGKQRLLVPHEPVKLEPLGRQPLKLQPIRP